MIKKIIKKITPGFALSFYHLLLAYIGALIYGFPSRKIKIVGLTGTKGKTTTVESVSFILNDQGHKVSHLSSSSIRHGDNLIKNKYKMTMPGRFKLQKFLRDAIRSGSKVAIFEVTSEGILQHRHRFIDFDIAVFTNLHKEHIEHHGSYENYREAKGRFFKVAKKVHILNIDDKEYEYFSWFKPKKRITFGFKEGDIKADRVSSDSFQVTETLFKSNLVGEFNMYNMLCAVTICNTLGLSYFDISQSISKIKTIPGRMEHIIAGDFDVYIDYAHTPDSLREVYKTFKENNLICLLGSAGGGRDKWKRPEFGKIADEYCDWIVLSNEDPYDENPEKIVEEVKEGISDKEKVEVIMNREEAIKRCLEIARQDDVIVATGKGSEPWICVKDGKKIPWNEKEKFLENYKS